jgi:hypothetical protein
MGGGCLTWSIAVHEVVGVLCVICVFVTVPLPKEQNSLQIVGAQPSDGSQIPGIRKWPQEYCLKSLMPQSGPYY